MLAVRDILKVYPKVEKFKLLETKSISFLVPTLYASWSQVSLQMTLYNIVDLDEKEQVTNINEIDVLFDRQTTLEDS